MAYLSHGPVRDFSHRASPSAVSAFFAKSALVVIGAVALLLVLTDMRSDAVPASGRALAKADRLAVPGAGVVGASDFTVDPVAQTTTLSRVGTKAFGAQAPKASIGR